MSLRPLTIVALLLAPAVCLEASRAADRPATALRIAPESLLLTGANRRQQLLITAESPTGDFDVTRLATVTAADPRIASLDQSTLVAAANGRTDVIVRYGQLEARVPVTVAGVDVWPAVHFANDVVPLLSKLGCNSGGCHGKQSGQNGFKLSVFGFDSRADYDALTKEARARRLFPADAAQSLLIRKATGQTAHGGGKRTDPGSYDHELLLQWVRQGMPWGSDDAPTVKLIRVEPADRVLATESEQQVLVTAVYADGSTRDVTSAAAYTSNAETIAEVEPGGRIHTGRAPGEAAVTINYMGHVGVARVVVPRTDAPNPYPELDANNPIDQFVWTKLKRLGIVPSGLADDSTFYRRLALDTTGTLPEPRDVQGFLASANPNKRAEAIDAFLAKPEFADYWAQKWADILLVDRASLGERGAFEFHRWLREQTAANRPYDEWVRELIAASGNSGRVGPVNFYRALRTPEDVTKAVSQAFLGVRLDCAQCHHHPFDKWGQDDFYAMSGFFTGLERKPLGDGREVVFHSTYRPAKFPLTGRDVATRPLDAAVPDALDDGDPRVKLAGWLTARDNPWFARLAANRLWKHYLGRGLIEPEDDLRTTNPATNEPLLEWLTQQIVAGGYDLKAVMRLILASRVYQLSSETNLTNRDDEQNFSHHLVRRLPAEVLLDAVSQVTGSPEPFPGMPPGTRAIQVWDNRFPSYFLDTFGRSERKSPCECAKSSEPTMAQALHLMNAPEIEAKIAAADGRIARLIAANKGRDEIVHDACYAALGRAPNAKEKRVAEDLFSHDTPRRAAQDFVWTLLNSYDFLFNR